jgi:hypothetical protein
MEIEREEVDRECNWALVSGIVAKIRDHGLTCLRLQIEFKSLPLTRSTVSGGADPRTSSSVFLFEEFVPLEYRQQLSAGVQKQWKQAATLNGRPYVVGHVPRGFNSQEEEFE